jgi:carboxyl-terminal processing protease
MAKSKKMVRASRKPTQKTIRTASTGRDEFQTVSTGKDGSRTISKVEAAPRTSSRTNASSRTSPTRSVKTSVTQFVGPFAQSASSQSPSSQSPTSQIPFAFRALSILISVGLVLTIGIQIGEKRKSSIVDNAIDTLVASQPDSVKRGILERAAIEAALKASGDAWANYFPKSTLSVLNEANTNSYSGIGASFRKSRAGVIEISGVNPQSPAREAGIRVGDQVLEINGTDIQGASLTSAIALIRGALGAKVDLLVLRENKKVLLSVTTRKISATSIEATQVAPNVGLIAISDFSMGTAKDFTAALEKLKIQKGLIIDLRNNPGGLIEEAVKVAENFIGNGAIVSYRVNDNEKVYSANNRIPITVPLVVMINRSTASAAEILASAIQDRNRGVVIGERSYGKGSVQEFRTLEDGSKLELTVALYITPSGRTIEGVGVTPDLTVAPADLGIKSLQILGGLASLGTKK